MHTQSQSVNVPQGIRTLRDEVRTTIPVCGPTTTCGFATCSSSTPGLRHPSTPPEK